MQTKEKSNYSPFSSTMIQISPKWNYLSITSYSWAVTAKIYALVKPSSYLPSHISFVSYLFFSFSQIPNNIPKLILFVTLTILAFICLVDLKWIIFTCDLWIMNITNTIPLEPKLTRTTKINVHFKDPCLDIWTWIRINISSCIFPCFYISHPLYPKSRPKKYRKRKCRWFAYLETRQQHFLWYRYGANRQSNFQDFHIKVQAKLGTSMEPLWDRVPLPNTTPIE